LIEDTYIIISPETSCFNGIGVPIASGVQLVQSNSVQFHYHHTEFSSQIKSKCGHILTKVSGLRIVLNIDGQSVVSRSHPQPSHSLTVYIQSNPYVRVQGSLSRLIG
jgi:hypothetical protein